MKASILLSVVLAGTLLAAVFLVGTTSSAGVYNPWYDLDDDGDIDIFDIVRMAGAYGTTGEPFEAKAALEYDSGWIDIADKAGQYFNVTHGLNSTDIMVDIQGKTTVDGGAHQIYLGGEGYLDRWSRTYGGTGQDGVGSSGTLIQTLDGGYAISGYTNSSGAGDADFWLVKTDWTGNTQWNKTYGGANADYGHSVIQTSDGGYAIAGETASFGAGSIDAWLVKTDASGNMVWNKTYGGVNADFWSSVIQTSDGGYAIGGYTASFGLTKTQFWLLKTDAAGNEQWSKLYGGGDVDPCYSMIQTGDGGYALAGYRFAGSNDLQLLKTDSAGNQEWIRQYGAGGHEAAYSVVQTVDGGYALAGYTSSYGAGDRDAWLVKTDAAGNLVWSQTYGGTNTDYGWSVVQTVDGGYALAGSTSSFGAGGWDFWLIRTGSAGAHLWNKTLGGINTDHGWSVVQTVDGGYAIAGQTGSYGAGGDDVWLVKMDSAGNVQPGFRFGLAWTDSTANSLALYKGGNDSHWNYVRVRVWKIKE